MSDVNQETIEQSLVHITVFTSILGLLFMVVVFLIQYRYRKHRRLLNQIPRARMRNTKKDIPETALRHIYSGFQEASRIHDQILQFAQTQQKPGWHKSEWNYKRVVADSPFILEQLAKRKDPSLARLDSQSVRAYMQFLLKKEPELNPKLCKYFVEMYERARFSEDEFTERDFINFLQNFAILKKFFEIE
ncbi:nice-3 [Anaeramoeba ignava]|uniref:Nice-3 n=1 Tax=Anaeramoeba ignava TaxID=1746090 RepID=A0A9Q0L8U5_ANAIG|nr:nice-3 [Anaeramoeba ignava]